MLMSGGTNTSRRGLALSWRPSRFVAFLSVFIGGAVLVPGARAETLTIPATTSGAVTSSVLSVGIAYRIEATGTYGWGTGTADAEWILSGVSGTPVELYPAGGFTLATDTLDLLIGGVAVNWMGTADGINWAAHTYSPSHVYRLEIAGAGNPLAFSIADQTPFGPGYYSDNGGSLAVDISVVPEASSGILFGLVGLGLLGVRRCRSR